MRRRALQRKLFERLCGELLYLSLLLQESLESSSKAECVDAIFDAGDGSNTLWSGGKNIVKLFMVLRS